MMETTVIKKPQIHQSMIGPMCWWQWLPVYGYIFDIWPVYEPMAPSLKMVAGSTGHEAAAFDLKYKMQNGILRPLDEVTDFARDSLCRYWDDGIMLDEAESQNPDRSKNDMLTKILLMVELHHTKVAPIYERILAVEKPFVIELTGGQFYDFAGTMDLVVPREVVDFKFVSGLCRTNVEHAAKTIQGGMYSEGYRVEYGELPDKFSLAQISRTKKPDYQILSVKPDYSWIDPLFRRVEWLARTIKRARQHIEETGNEYAAKDIFPPVSPDGPHSWICTKYNCGFAEHCEAWTGR